MKTEEKMDICTEGQIVHFSIFYLSSGLDKFQNGKTIFF